MKTETLIALIQAFNFQLEHFEGELYLHVPNCEEDFSYIVKDFGLVSQVDGERSGTSYISTDLQNKFFHELCSEIREDIESTKALFV